MILSTALICHHLNLPVILQILNSITADVFQHEGSFRNPEDQVDFIVKTLKEGTAHV